MNNWKEELKKADVDVEGTIDCFNKKEDRYIKYLKLFTEDTSYAGLKRAIEEKDSENAFRFCYDLQVVTGNLGFKTLYHNVSAACNFLKTGKIEPANALIMEIEPNYSEIIQIIEKYLQ